MAASPIAAAATPKKILKITICNISLLDMASNMLFGKTCSTKLIKLKDFVFPSKSLAPLVSALLNAIPSPGLKIFTSTSPINKLTSDAVINHNMALPPTRPTVFKSPNFAIPTTKVLNTSGAIIICTKRKKMVVNNLLFLEKLAIVCSL